MFEQMLNNAMFSGRGEKTYIDKLLAKEDIKSIRELVKKPELNREDMLELLDYLSSAEIKLVNFDGWNRYVMNKFYIWIRDFCRMYELIYDYEDQLKEKNIVLSESTKKLFGNTKLLLSHDVKFLADLYLNLIRSTLSLGGSAFLEFSRNRFEFNYPVPGMSTQQPQPNSGQLYGAKEKGLFK